MVQDEDNDDYGDDDDEDDEDAEMMDSPGDKKIHDRDIDEDFEHETETYENNTQRDQTSVSVQPRK